MGYDIHLTKTEDWSEEANRFTKEEWERIIRQHDVKSWLYFEDGRISVKNPSEDQVIALIKISKAYGWAVQGDDGEKYSEDGSPIEEELSQKESRPFGGILGFLQNMLANRRAKKKIASSMENVACPFKVGDKVRNSFRTGGVVIAVDRNANHGMGSIKVRFPDGRVIGSAFIGHDLEFEP